MAREYPTKRSAESHLALAESDFQFGLMDACKHTRATIDECLRKRWELVADVVNNQNPHYFEYLKFKQGPDSCTSPDYDNCVCKDTDSQGNNLGRNPFDNVSVKNDIAQSWVKGIDVGTAVKPAFTSAAGARAFCLQYVHEFERTSKYGKCNPVDCFCTEYEFTDEPSERYTISNDDRDELTEYDEQSNEVSVSVYNAVRDARITASNPSGNVIPEIYGEVIVGGSVIWIDRPYYVPYVEYFPIEEVILSENVSGSTSISKKYKAYTNVLISLGSNGIDNVYSVVVDGVTINKNNYEILDGRVRHVHDGDFNALHNVPGYRDHTILYIHDVEVMNFSDIKVHVQKSINSYADLSYETSSTTLPSNAKHIQFGDNVFMYFLNGDIITRNLQHPFIESAISHNLPTYVTSEPAWWYVKGSIIYFHWAGMLHEYDSVTGIDNILFNIDATNIIAYIKYSNSWIYWHEGLLHNGIVTINIDEPDKIIPFDNYADAFDYTANIVYRFVPDKLEVVKYNLLNRTSYDEIIVTTDKYVVLADGVVDIYSRENFEHLHTIENVSISNVNFVSDEVSYNSQFVNFINGTKITTIDLINFVSSSIDAPVAVHTPLFQIMGDNTLFSINAAGDAYIIDTAHLRGVSSTITVGDLLNELNYPVKQNVNIEITGAVNVDTQALIDNLVSMYDVPQYESTNEIIISPDSHTIDVDFRSTSKEYVKLNYPDLDIGSEGTKSITFNQTGNGEFFNLSSLVTLSYEQAYLLAANYYYRMTNAQYSIDVETFSMLEDIGTAVVFDDKTYRVIEHNIDGFAKYKGVSISKTLITEAPDEPQPSSVSPVYVWDFEGTKLMFIPIVIDIANPNTYCYIGERPKGVCTNYDCDVPVPDNAMTAYGQLVDPMPSYRNQDISGIKDEETSIYIKFQSDITSQLNSATYSELINDKFKNLIIVGHEAIQFTDFTLQPDNRTVKFHGTLLRGRFNSSFFINFHLANEMCFVYDTSTVSQFSTEYKEFTMFVKGTSDKLYVNNIVSDYYNGTVNITRIDLNGKKCVVKAQNCKDNPVTIKFSFSPIIFGNDYHPIVQSVLLNNDDEFEFTISERFHNTIHWIAEADNKLPAYGYLTQPSTTYAMRNKKPFSYAVLSPRNTLYERVTSTYILMVS
jgi:hypothetical protein